MSDVMERVIVRPAEPRVAPSSPVAPRRTVPALFTSISSALEQRRLFVLLPFVVILGMTVSLWSEAAAPPATLAAVASLLPVGLFIARTSTVGFRIMLLASAFWTGFCLLPVHGVLSGTEMLARPAYGTYEARVDEIVSEAESGRRVIISGITPVTDARAVPMRRARIVIGDTLALAPGDIIAGPMRFYAVPGPVVPGGHDTQFHSYFDGVGAYGNATGAITLVRPGEGGLERAINGIRQGIGQRIDAEMTGPAAGLARSMMIGDQSRIDDGTREVMAESGLAHIYSISGLHLTIVAGGTLAVLRLLLAPFPGLGRFGSTKKVAALGAIAAALFYLMLAGGSSNVPAFRSTIMIALIFGAVLAGRRALTMRNAAIAAGIIILTDPASVFRPSFQLSFAAVVALLGTYELVRRDGEAPKGWVRQGIGILQATAVTSLVAGTATLLFSAYHFQQTAPLGLLANLMAIILITPIMLAIVLAGLTMPLGLEAIFLKVLQVGLDGLLWIAVTVSEWSAGLVLHPLLTPLALLLGLLALAWFAFIPNWWRLMGPAVLVPGVLILAMDRPPDVLVADTTRAVAMRTAEGLMLIDGKPESFAVEVWRETYGEAIGAGAPKCDGVACLATSSKGFRVAIVDDPAGFYEDCAAVDLVITRRDAPKSCAAAVVIDADALAYGGVHWLAWTGDRFETRAAKTGLSRPWRVSPR